MKGFLSLFPFLVVPLLVKPARPCCPFVFSLDLSFAFGAGIRLCCTKT